MVILRQNFAEKTVEAIDYTPHRYDKKKVNSNSQNSAYMKAYPL